MPPASRRTLNDPEHFVIPQFWETDDHTAWWDLSYLHSYIKRHGWEKMKRQKWFKRKFMPQAHLNHGVPEQPAPVEIDVCTSDTLGLVTFLWISVDTCRNWRMSDACVRFMRGMISKATLLVADFHAHMVFDSMSCRVYNGGQMVGFTSLCSVMHRAMQKLLRDMWTSMHERGILDGAFDCDRHSVMDVATFYMRLLRARRQNRQKITTAFDALCNGSDFTC